MMHIRREVVPFIGIIAVVSVCTGLVLQQIMAGIILLLIGTLFLLYFFRDPERTPPPDPSGILAGADGRVMSVTRHNENTYLQTDSIRISIFLNLFNVHVNRSPMTGNAKFLGYFPGKKFFAFQEKSSEYNQNNKILIEGTQTRCLVVQIVGPFVRRVVYWLDHETSVLVKAGDRIGMMKFGSRMDIYLPASDVDVVVTPGNKVRAGETVIARITSIQNAEEKVKS